MKRKPVWEFIPHFSQEKYNWKRANMPINCSVKAKHRADSSLECSNTENHFLADYKGAWQRPRTEARWWWVNNLQRTEALFCRRVCEEWLLLTLDQSIILNTGLGESWKDHDDLHLIASVTCIFYFPILTGYILYWLWSTVINRQLMFNPKYSDSGRPLEATRVLFL